MEGLVQQLRALDANAAVKVISTWLEEHQLKHVLDSFHEAVLTDPALLGAQAHLTPPPPPQTETAVKPPNAAPLTAPPAEALPVPTSSTSSRPGKLYDTEPISASSVRGELLMKPDPVFHGERDERQREAAPIYEFPMHVRRRPLRSRLESAHPANYLAMVRSSRFVVRMILKLARPLQSIKAFPYFASQKI